MLKSQFEFEVLVNGHSAKEYRHEGSNYIEGKEGSRFSLRMCNNSSHRVLFVPTVDGLSIMNGKEASYKSRGYIVNAHDSLTIDGWRTSDDKVAEFFFSSPKNSYAKKKDKGGNLGVIGCAVFKEKEQVRVIEKIIKEYIPITPPPFPKEIWPTHPYPVTYWSTSASLNDQFTVTTTENNGTVSANYLCQSSGSSPSLSDKALTKNTVSAGLGTGFGQDKYSPTVSVDFDKESSPAEVFSLYYNTRENLEALGVEFRKAVYVAPSAFPNEDGYCERP